jgi:diguanylate cyclase (GGDEF)-like protein
MPRWITLLKTALRWDEDAFALYRDRVARHLTVLAAILLLPFTLMHLVAGREMLALVIGLAQAVLVANTVAERRGHAPPVPFLPMVVVLVVAVCASVGLQGVNGAFWSYPTLFICYFVLPRRQALVLGLALLVGASAVALYTLGGALAARIFATLLLTLVMINVVLNVVADLQKALVEQAITDPLTGAFNRRHMQVQLDRIVLPGQPARATDMPHALLAIDIDHFKRINDRHGHAMGDHVLRETVATIRARKRRGDLLFRTGGEEFVLLLLAGEADARQLAEDLRVRIEAAAMLPGERVTVSIGVRVQRAGESAELWLREADRALYQAKSAGRNRVEVAA